MELVAIVGYIIGSYFLGACPTAYIIGKMVKHIDIRDYGSGNVGATNVFRTVGKRWGVFVLVLDALKGFLAVTLWARVHSALGFGVLDMRVAFLLGIIAVAGHNWTVFLNFKGGKGVSTTMGILLGLFPVPVFIAAGIAFTLIGITHYVSVGSIVGALLFPVVFYFFNNEMPHFTFFFCVVVLIASLLIFKHKANILRLIKGKENKAF